MSKRIDLTGRVFGRLTVIECVGKNKQGCAVWHCRCECGNEKDISGSNLRRGSTLSCGCYMIDGASGYNPAYINQNIK